MFKMSCVVGCVQSVYVCQCMCYKCCKSEVQFSLLLGHFSRQKAFKLMTLEGSYDWSFQLVQHVRACCPI